MTTGRHPSVPDDGGHRTNHRRKAIPATCQLDRGPVEPADLMVSRHCGMIVFDPQVPGSCVISLDEWRAARLRDLLTEWLG